MVIIRGLVVVGEVVNGIIWCVRDCYSVGVIRGVLGNRLIGKVMLWGDIYKSTWVDGCMLGGIMRSGVGD